MVDIKEMELKTLPQQSITDCFSLFYRKIFDSSNGNQFNSEPIAGKVENNGKKMVRILVVDDDLIFSKSFTAILKDKGYNVEWVNSGNSAIAQLENKYFDIVFLDVKLPDTNGAEVLKRVKAISPKTNVIMITAFSFDEFAEELIQLGAFAYFNKPFDISLAIRAIEELIE